MTEIISSRSVLTAIGAIAFLTGAVLCWAAPATQEWTIWAAVVFAAVGIGFGWRLIAPEHATLHIDKQGLRWWLGPRLTASIYWRDIRRIHENGADGGLTLDIDESTHVQIPPVFLRSAERRREFLRTVAKYRPDLRTG